ncbi:MAG: hypothetical protein Kow00122_21210 [Thermoleophilia bacterium]
MDALILGAACVPSPHGCSGLESALRRRGVAAKAHRRARAAVKVSRQGQATGRESKKRRAERVSRPGRAK